MLYGLVYSHEWLQQKLHVYQNAVAASNVAVLVVGDAALPDLSLVPPQHHDAVAGICVHALPRAQSKAERFG